MGLNSVIDSVTIRVGVSKLVCGSVLLQYKCIPGFVFIPEQVNQYLIISL